MISITSRTVARIDIPRHTMPTTLSPQRGGRKLTCPAAKKRRPPLPGMSGYDWKVAAVTAELGLIPPAPKFHGRSNERYYPVLQALLKAAQRGDVATLRGFPLRPYNSGTKILVRYRALCMVAVERARS